MQSARRGPWWWLWVVLGCVCPVSLWPAPSPRQVAVQWQFDKPGDRRGWVANAHIRDATVSDGALRGVTRDWDPILLGPVFEIAATPAQCVEIKMRTPRGGMGQLFWTQTIEGRYGGFSEEKSCRFPIRSGPTFQVYRLHPFWHAAGKIVRLRLDPPATGEFAIQWIRVVDEGSPERTPAKAWRFASGTHHWRAWQEVSAPAIVAGHLQVKAEGNSPMLMSPLLSIPADENAFVSIRMAVSRGRSGRVFCVSSSQFGRGEVSFPLRTDGRFHTYVIDAGHLKRWQDQIILLGVQPTDVTGAEVSIDAIEVADAPRGPPELAIDYFGPTEGVNRAERPAELTLQVRNLGGAPARDVVATLAPGQGLKVSGSPRQSLGQISYWLPQTATWPVQPAEAGRVPATVTLEGANLDAVSTTTTLEFTAQPPVSPGDYIPEPRPVKSPYEIGAFYFPGWHSMARWQPILDYPKRKPVLGWYDEANPECADWQIKWAVEHGITFFMVDWYWNQGHRQLEHWLHQAYRHARFRHDLKWAVMWANHNPPHTHDAEDWRQVTRYWIEHYFGLDEYFRINGRPAVFIWAPANIRHDVGGSESAARLYAMSQTLARAAGLPGIYFVAMSSHDTAAGCRQLKAEGYEAFTSYHGFQLAARRAGSKRFPFADVVATSPQLWREADARASGLNYFPIVETGWASQPWHGNQSLVITDRTPEQFGRLCRAARAYADRTHKRIIALGPWNEWGEGSYLEPCTEFGFGHLDQLRAAFCPPGNWPPNLIPADVGRGPYDLPLPARKDGWNFNTAGDFEGWTPNGFLNGKVADGWLTGETTGPDPILQGPGVRIDAARKKRLTIRLRADTDGWAQLFWATATSSQNERNSTGFRVLGDGQFHDYELDLSQSPRWRGLITSLRFDPAAQPGVHFALDFLRFEKRGHSP